MTRKYPRPRRGPVSLERAYEVARIFGFREPPSTMPYATATGLDIPPEGLSEHEINLIAAAAAIPLHEGSPWYIGDLLDYLAEHTDAPVSFDAIFSKFRRAGLKTQTLHNYKSVSRQFALSQRMAEPSWYIHSLVRALPPARRAELLRRAYEEQLTAEQVNLLLRAESGATRQEVLAIEINAQVKHLYSRRPENVRKAVARCQELLEELKILDD